MANLKVGPIYTRIGEVLAEHVDGDPVGTLLIAEAGDSWVGGAIFKIAGDRIIYDEPDEALLDLITEAWEAEDDDKRWVELHYRLLDGRFSAKLVYAEEIDPAEESLGRRARIVAEVFGSNKPIDYTEALMPE